MNARVRIGFDFDKVFVNHPPIIPEFLIDYLYKGSIVFRKKKRAEMLKLNYRIPGFFEQQIRILSHNRYLRPPLSGNIRSLRKIAEDPKSEVYLISSRFGFLKNQTHRWLERHKLTEQFDGIHFNFNNNQPHIFKERMIKKLHITHYIDDDLDLLLYIATKHPTLKLFWVSPTGKTRQTLPKNITIIKTVRELYNKHL